MRLRPTRLLLWSLLGLGVLFVQAYMHNLNLVYILLFFLVAFAVISYGFARENLAALRVVGFEAGRLFAGQEGECRLLLERSKSGTSWGVVWHHAAGSVGAPPVGYGRRVALAMRGVPPRRGWWRLDPCRLVSRFPLGLFRAEIRGEFPCRLLVFPRPRGVSLEQYLRRRSGPFGEESDFDGLGSYSGGESLSRIHWPSVAKGEPAVKRFLRETHGGTPVLDFADAGETVDARLEQLTLWVLECEREGRAFELVLPGRTLLSVEEGVDAILETLALY